MFRVVHLSALVALILSVTACAGVQKGQPIDRINGLVSSVVDGVEKPVAIATVKLSIDGNEELIGVGTTTFAGTFFIDRLSNRLTQQEARLLRDQEYVIEIQAPEHFLMKQRFTFGKGAEDWIFILDSKTADLGTDDSLMPPTGPSNRLTFGGSVRRGK
jgi:hypothetical protein